MIKTALYAGALTAVLIGVACSNASSPVAPASNLDSLFTPVSQPARIYVAADSKPSASRYVLYDNGTFALQYVRGGEYLGTYTEANALITFGWEGSSTAGPWGATGSVSADSLTVRYNLVMQLSDFEDGVYTRFAN